MEDAPAAMIFVIGPTMQRLLSRVLYLTLVFGLGVAFGGTPRAIAGPHLAEVTPKTTPAAPQPFAPTPEKRCTTDEECTEGTICDWGKCQAFERPLNILLFRKEGPKTAVIPFYWSRQGNPGYRILAPFYFHGWDPSSRYRIVAPIYWRFEDYPNQRVVLVVPPYARTTSPDARSHAVWPLFYYSTKFGWAAPLLLSYNLQNPEKGTSHGMITPLSFWKRSKEGSFTWIFPLNFQWRDKDDRNLLAIPLFYRNAHPHGGTFASLLGYSSVDREATTGSFLWLYWYGRSESSKYDVLFPLLWSFRSPTSNVTLLPPVFHYRNEGYTLGTAALLAYWGKDEAAGTSWQLVPPVLFRRVTDHGKKAYYLWPFGIYRRDDTAKSRRLTMLLPPLMYHRDAAGSLDYYLLYYRRINYEAESYTSLVGPYYHRKDLAGSTRALFPLFFSFRDSSTGATARALFPFYFRRNAPHETLTAAGIFPLWAYRRTLQNGGGSAGLFPLAFFGSQGPRSHAILFPLFWRFSNEKSATTLVLPIFYRSWATSKEHTAIFPLLYFSGRSYERRYRIQFPFLFQVANEDLGTSTTVVPPLYFRHQTPAKTTSGILPLIFWGTGPQKRHLALFPLFWYFRDDAQDRTTTVVANYLHRRHGQETTDALFPIFHYRRGTRPGGSDERSLTLFPLFHYRRGARETVFASPLSIFYRSKEIRAGFAGPYFWYRGPKVAVQAIPLLFLDHTQLDTQKRTRMWGPWVALDSPTLTARALLPLFAHYRTPAEEGTFVFPCYFQRQTKDGYHLKAFLPLYWRSHWPTGHTTQVGPYFSHTSETSRSTGLLPLFVSYKGKPRDWFISPLYVSSTRHETGTHKAVAPLYYASTTPTEGLRVVFPLWWQMWNTQRQSSVLFPFYWSFKNHAQASRTTFWGPFYSSQRQTERTRGLLPLFWYTRDQNRLAIGVLPLFYSNRTATARTFLTLPFGFKKAPDQTTFYMGPFAWHDTWKSKFHMLFPLYFYSASKELQSSTLLIPPLLYYGKTSPERSLHSLALLFWRKTTVTSSMTLGLPFFFDFHSYHQNRLTMLLPLFARYRDQINDQSYSVAPLFYRRRGPTDSTTIVFPLFWRFANQERSTTLLLPLYVGVQRPNWSAHYIFPNIYYRKGRGEQAGTSHLFIFPFWESRVKRPGDYMWEALLGTVGWERVGRNRFLKLLFIPFELEPAPAAKTAWYGKPQPKDRTARSIDVRTW